MNKLISKIVGVCLGLSLATGVGASLALNNHEFKNAKAVDDVTISVNIGTLVDEKGWERSSGTTVNTKLKSIDLDSNITISTSGEESNEGSFWGSGTSTDWRLYRGGQTSGFGTFTITATNGYVLKSFTAKFSTSNSGILATAAGQSKTAAVTSNTAKSVSGTSVTFCVANSGTKTNGQIRITDISVTYYLSEDTVADYTLSYGVSPFGTSNSSNTGTETVTLSGIEYASKAGYKYANGMALSFNRNQSGAYLGNNTAYSKAIDKIVIDLSSAVSNTLTMYRSATALAETASITPTLSNSNKTATYDFDGMASFFFLKLTTTGTYVNIEKISIYLSSSSPSLLDMTIVDSTISEGPFSMRFGSYGGLLLYAHDGTEAISSGVTWSVGDSDIIDLDDDFADNHCWVKPGTEVGETTVTAEKEGYITAVATITVIKGDLEQIAVSGSMTTTAYALNSDWDPTGLAVTAVYETGYSDDVTDEATWTFSPATANSLSVTSVVATASYTEDGITKTKSSDAQTVSVFAGATYDLTKIDGFSSWETGYGAHSIDESDFNPAVSTAASLDFLKTNRQNSGIGSTYPCIGGKNNTEATCLTFTLDETNCKITTVTITFVTRYTATYPSLYLHKGNGIESTPVSSLTMSGDAGDEHTLTCSSLNDKVFTVGYNAHQTGSNGAVGIKSITIGLAEASSFGTVDHIKVTSLPKTIYHYGEVYDSTGLTVVAYDDADESTANFKDVTASINSRFTSGIYTFDDADIPTTSMWISYTEGGSTYYADDIVFRVYPVATYELVTDDAPFDWSGEYLIVGAHTVDEVTTYYAMDGSLENPDVDGGHQTVTVDTYTIEAGQELAWKITPVTGGYSIQGSSGKYIGSLTAKNNGMLVSDTPVVNELSLDGINTTITGTNGYHLKFNPDVNGRFRYYSSGSVQLYKLVDSTDAFDFADEFLDMLSSGSEAVCDADGNTDLDELKVAWAILAYDYSQLDASDKEQFRLGIANEGGTLVQQALALYDYITEKYGTDLESEDCDNYDFMNRAALSGANPRISPINGGNSAITMAIIVVAALTVTTAGAYFFLRKKKEEK